MRQGSKEWLEARLGRATSSNFGAVLAKGRSGEALTRKRYKIQLVTERLTGAVSEGYTSSSMLWGTQQEPYAKIAYMEKFKVPIEDYGFVEHPKIKVGTSPDGGVPKNGGAEFKCPETHTHVGYLLGESFSQYIPQIQGQMWIMEWDFVDFVSFDPRMPEKSQLFVQRVPRDNDYIKNLETEVIKFLTEVDELEKRLK